MRLPLIATLLITLMGPSLRSDEGMWTFDNLPLQQLKQKYDFTPDKAWLDHVRLSALHFGGGSGSFVSDEGLVITNHHVGRGWIQQVSGPGDKDYIKLGFLAKNRSEELKVPGATLRTLMLMENVTDKVNASVQPGMDEKAAVKAKEKAFSDLANAKEKETGLSCQTLSLYQGGEFWIYGYKVHKDIRLVMAPETQIASFGGDPDNFTYPRFDLDFCMFRVYENDKPVKPQAHLKWAQEGLQTGDLTFVVGHPGRTERLNTWDQMRFAKEVALPTRIQMMNEQRAWLLEYAAISPEHARQVKTRIYGIENGLKATIGYLSGFKNQEAMARIQAKEKELQARVSENAQLKAETAESWLKVEKALEDSKALLKENQLLNTRGSAHLGAALSLVRLIEEAAKPESERMPGFESEESRREILERMGRMFSNGNPELDNFMLKKNLQTVQKELGESHPFTQALLDGKDVEAILEALKQSKVSDEAWRNKLLKGGIKALNKSTDPAIRIAKAINPLLKDLSKRNQDLGSILAEHSSRISKARFAVYGKSLYPDATLTLRLTFGPVETYAANGTLAQPFTTFHGLFDRAIAWGPKAENGAWALPERWVNGKEKLNLETPYNFCHSVDIIGGNSGSPVINRKGEFVGVIFDGNIEMLPGNFFYDASNNRGVSLDGRAIIEVLNKLYDAKHLVTELTGK